MKSYRQITLRNKMIRKRMFKCSFTLLEMLLALLIIVVIVSTVYSFYHFSVKMIEAGRAKLAKSQLARILLDKIGNEIRAITPAGKEFTTVLEGAPDSITFVTIVLPSRLAFFPAKVTDSSRLIEHDFRRITYSIARDEENENAILGLRRDELRCMLTPLIERKSSEELKPKELEQQRVAQEKFRINFDMGINRAFSNQPIMLQQLISDKIKYLRFDYYDGNVWQSSWNSANKGALPRAILITIGFTEMKDEQWQEQLMLPPNQREFREDDYSLLVPLILSGEINSTSGASETK